MTNRMARLPIQNVTAILMGIGLFLLAVALQYGPTSCLSVGKQPLEFTTRGSGSWVTEAAGLPAGAYYLSTGRPRGECEVLRNGAVLASNRSAEGGLRDALLVGASFRTVPVERNVLEIRCDKPVEFGSFNRLPVLLPRWRGLTVQLTQAFIDLLLGPLSALVLAYSAWGFAEKGGRKKRVASLGFACCAFAYAVSIAHYPRLFLRSDIATAIHAFIRVAVGLSFYLFVGSYCKIRRSVVIAHAAMLAVVVIASAVALPKITSIYLNRVYPVLPLLALVVAYDASVRSIRTREQFLVTVVAVGWFISHLVDLAVRNDKVALFVTPSVITLTVFAIYVLRRIEDERMARISETVKDVTRIVESQVQVKSALREIAELLRDRTGFARYSAYIDASVFGMCSGPGKKLIRLFEDGYKKDTRQDQEIEFSAGRGLIMEAALRSGAPQVEHSEKDRAWYAVMPIGEHAVINLSDDHEKHPYHASESREYFLALRHCLGIVGKRLKELSRGRGLTLECLKYLKDEGEWSGEAGAIVVDLNGFASMHERFGKPYEDFLYRVYWPEMGRTVRQWAVRTETPKGDMVKFLCIRDLMHQEMPISRALYESLREILSYSRGAGADLCRQHGFPALPLQIGASLGEVSILIEDWQICPSGDVLTEVARLQAAAAPGSTLVSRAVAENWPNDGPLEIARPSPVLAKLRRMEACSVSLRGR